MTNYTKPTLKELRNRAISDLNTYLKGADANLRRRVLNVIATICAGIGDEILRRADYILKQVFIKEADPQSLIKHGQERRFPRKSASKASGAIIIYGTNGSVIPEGTACRRSDNLTYTSTEELTIDNTGTGTLKIEADDAGSASNSTAGTIISFVSPVTGVETKGTVDSLGITGGADLEDIEKYRERLLYHVQNPPAGGADTDYITWAEEVAGVNRAWCYPNESGNGTVTVRFMMDDIYEDGIPLTADVQKVNDFICDGTKKPVTATLYVCAPISDPINFVFSALSPNTTESKTAIENSLKSLIQSSSVVPGGTLKLSKIRASISNATGNEDFTLTSPSADITMATGHISTMGTITYPEVTNG